MYEPPRSFMKDLKSLDRHLGCEYVQKYERFIITYKRAVGQPVPVFVVETEDNQFRFPDRRDLEKLKECDLERESVDSKFKRISAQVWDSQMKKMKQATQEWKERTMDDKYQLANRFAKLAGYGKGNSTFRRITPKPKGEAAE